MESTPKKRKKVISARKICRTVIDVPGINKRTGQLLKGWHYVKGKPVKVTKATTTKKRGLKSPLSKAAFPGQCPICRTTNGSIYVPASGYNCDFKAGDRCLTRLAKPAKKTVAKKATSKQTAAQNAFKANAAKARQLVASGKAKTLKAAWAMLKKK